MRAAALPQAVDDAGLLLMGALDPESGGTLVLLGAGAAFWPVFRAAPESGDGQPDPIDRWSTRVVTALAQRFEAEAVFPFGGPPFQPFIRWALESGRAFQSPTGMLVHDRVGLMISYRGALRFTQRLDLPGGSGRSPCVDCDGQPCVSACPVGALGADHPYDLKRCHDYLDTDAGQGCMTQGCAVRRACPLSVGAGRSDAQSAMHMRAFHRR